MQAAHACISVSAECKGSPITLEDVLFAARGLVPVTEDTADHAAGAAVASKPLSKGHACRKGCTYRGFVLVGCTHAGVLTLRPQID